MKAGSRNSSIGFIKLNGLKIEEVKAIGKNLEISTKIVDSHLPEHLIRLWLVWGSCH